MPTSTDEFHKHSTDELIRVLKAAKSQEAAKERPAAANESSDESGLTDQILRSLRKIKLSQAKSAEEGMRSDSQGNWNCGFTTPADVELSDVVMGSGGDSEGSEVFYGHKLSVDTNPYSKLPIERVIPGVGGWSSESEEDHGVKVGDKVEGFDEQAYQNEEVEDDDDGEDGMEKTEQGLDEGIFSEWGEWIGSSQARVNLI
jgi:hypothetical protein